MEIIAAGTMQSCSGGKSRSSDEKIVAQHPVYNKLTSTPPSPPADGEQDASQVIQGSNQVRPSGSKAVFVLGCPSSQPPLAA